MLRAKTIDEFCNAHTWAENNVTKLFFAAMDQKGSKVSVDHFVRSVATMSGDEYNAIWQEAGEMAARCPLANADHLIHQMAIWHTLGDQFADTQRDAVIHKLRCTIHDKAVRICQERMGWR